METFRQDVLHIALWCLCIHGFWSFAEAQSSTGQREHPNVLLFIVDDLRTTLGCYEEPTLQTPNIDNLASKSILFKQAFVQQAVCGPSRVSFLTSRRPDTTRLYDFFSYWRVHAGNYTTLPQHFKENGYITQAVSKVFHPGIAGNRSDDARYSWTNTPYHPSTQQYKNAKVCPDKNGTLGMNVVCPIDVPLMPEQSLPDIQSAAYAYEFLKNTSETQPDQPFFLAVGFHKPHIPLKYPKKYKSLYPLPQVKLAEHNTYPWGMPLVAFNPYKDFRGRDDIIRLNLSFPFGPIPNYYQLLIRQSYYAATSYMDAQVGRVLLALERFGFSENTIVAFISDHGFALGEHQVWAKYSLFEVAVRVPFIMYIPGVTYKKVNKREKIFPFLDLFKRNESIVFETSTPLMGGTQEHQNQVSSMSSDATKTWVFKPRYETSALVELVDLFPTLAEAAGLPTLPLCPDDPFKTRLCTEGVSLMPLIKNITRNVTNVNTDRNIVGDESCMPKQTLTHLLAKNCSEDFTAAVSDGIQWKSAAFSQYPRPSAYTQRNTEIPLLVDIRIMGYSMWTPDFRYTEWVRFIPDNYTIVWEEVYGRELYLRSSDPHEINNVALLERCFPLMLALSKQLRIGWRGALPE